MTGSKIGDSKYMRGPGDGVTVGALRMEFRSIMEGYVFCICILDVSDLRLSCAYLDTPNRILVSGNYLLPPRPALLAYSNTTRMNKLAMIDTYAGNPAVSQVVSIYARGLSLVIAGEVPILVKPILAFELCRPSYMQPLSRYSLTILVSSSMHQGSTSW
jgi:hypothetical protein